MAHFYGTIQGHRGEASRMGSKRSGFQSVAASWEGAIEVSLWHDEEKKRDMCQVIMKKWYGSGEDRVLYVGAIGKFEDDRKRDTLSLTMYCPACQESKHENIDKTNIADHGVCYDCHSQTLNGERCIECYQVGHIADQCPELDET